MTVNLPIDPETERVARKLAEVRGQPLPLVVREAIIAAAAKAGVSVAPLVSREDLLAKMLAATDEFARFTVLDPRAPDEIVGYDEHGVPQ